MVRQLHERGADRGKSEVAPHSDPHADGGRTTFAFGCAGTTTQVVAASPTEADGDDEDD